MMEVIRSSETSVLTTATQRHGLEDVIVHIHRRENLKTYVLSMTKYVRFKVLTTVVMPNSILCNISPCSLLRFDPLFEGRYFLHFRAEESVKQEASVNKVASRALPPKCPLNIKGLQSVITQKRETIT
jgi:hypothetical protein